MPTIKCPYCSERLDVINFSKINGAYLVSHNYNKGGAPGCRKQFYVVNPSRKKAKK